jgi:FixJ family two-component response regulator
VDRFEARRGDDGHDRAAKPAADDVKKILIVSQDAPTLDLIATVLTQQIEVQLTCVSNANFVFDREMACLHDLVILDVDGVEDFSSLLRSLGNAQPAVICVCGEKNLSALVQATRGSSGEILLKPIMSEELLEATQNALRGKEQSLQLATKYRKMRELVRRVVRERRDLNRRIELVCRDRRGSCRSPPIASSVPKPNPTTLEPLNPELLNAYVDSSVRVMLKL